MGGEIKISEEFLAILEEQYRKMIYNAYEWADNQRRESGIKVQPIKIKFPNAQTVYSCLNFAYDESKLRCRGELTEFHNDPREGSHQRLEKLHAARNLFEPAGGG